MKIHNKGSGFSPEKTETDNSIFHSPEHRRRKLQMENDNKIDSSEENGLQKGRFMRAVKAVLFQIKLRRRNREKRTGSDSTRRSSSNFSFRFRKQNADNNNKSKPDLPKSASSRSTSTSILSSSPSSSSASSARLSFQSSEPRTSVSSVSQPNPKPQKQSSFKEQRSCVEKEGRRSSSIMIGLVLILMSLGLTIMWGKVGAIAFNAMWLACVRQKRNLRRSEFGSDDVEKVEESVNEVRRRVIMEGLLDRRHHQQQQK